MEVIMQCFLIAIAIVIFAAFMTFIFFGGESMEYIYKEVNFSKYCPLCEYADLYEEKDPCNECLGIPMNEHSEKPVCYKPNEKKIKKAEKENTK